MSKDPAVLFYPNDYIGGTMGMTFEEKGAYMELLVMQFNRGHMGGHMIGQAVGHLWDKIQDKFIQDENGLWYNARFEQEIIKRKKYTESRRNNISGVNQYSEKQKKDNNKDDIKVGHMTSHMENENEDENINKNKGASKFKIPTILEISEYCKERNNKVDAERFFDYYQSKGWLVGKTKMKDWKASVRTWEKNEQTNNKNENRHREVSAIAGRGQGSSTL